MSLPGKGTRRFPPAGGSSRRRDAPRGFREESYSGPDTALLADKAKGRFFERVYAIVADIPRGKVMTYGQIAMLLDNVCSARYVGFAVSSAPAGRNLPCHRVVNRLGEMAPGNIFNGEDRQRELLRSEGVVFRENGRVDTRASLFRPE